MVALAALLGCGETPMEPAPVATALTVSAASLELVSFGASRQLTATVLDQNGATMSGAAVTWTSSGTAVASVSSSGLVTAHDNGTATISATSGSATATTEVTVAQLPDRVSLAPASLVMPGPGSTATLDAAVLDAGGSQIASAVVTWSSEDELVATVDGAGVVTAVGAGEVDLVAEGAVGGQTVAESVAVVVNATLDIATATLAGGTKNLPYGPAVLTATGGGGGYVWSLSEGALPEGLSLSAEGELTGRPTVPGTSDLTVAVTSGDGQTAERVLALTVDDSSFILPSALCSESPAGSVTTFQDQAFEAGVRSALGVDASAALTCDLVSSLGFLYIRDAGIESVVGVQNLTGLTDLRLEGNAVADIGPIASLTLIANLDLAGNPISDLSPLTELTAMSYLSLFRAEVTDIGPLAALERLSVLELSSNTIGDIGPLAQLTELTYLGLADNTIVSIEPLAELRALSTLGLQGNMIVDLGALEGLTALDQLFLNGNAGLSDIQPLIDNTGLGSGDAVSLDGTAVTCTDVTALVAKGVSVTSSCS